MRQKIRKACALLRDDRGSGIVMMLVVMMIVMMLAATVSYMSFIGYQMRATERLAETEFYDAQTALDEIRAGLQEAVSDSIAAAYEDVLINYNSSTYLTGYADMTEKFQAVFRDKLRSWSRSVDVSGTPTTLSLFADATSFDVRVLQSFVSSSNAVVDSTASAWTYDTTTKLVTLKGIEVEYTGRNDYVTTVSTDLTIGMPDFSYVFSEYSISGLPEFAVIAKTSLDQTVNSTTLTIDGSAYAGKMTLSGTGSTLTITGGSMVCGDKISVGGTVPSLDVSRFMVRSDASLWTNRIEVLTDSSVLLQGSSYLADDLELKGEKAQAHLEGNYYGFGNSITEADKSSAILVNAVNTKLDLGGLNRLMLAGHSFVGTSYTDNLGAAANGGTDVLMGESISVRQNQQAYLVPDTYFRNLTSNPYVCETGASIDTTLTPEGQAKMNDYHATVKKVTVNVPGMTNQQMNYFFMQFGDTSSEDRAVQAAATAETNRFFKEYFEDNTDVIEKYLEKYTDLSVNLRMSSQTAGYTLYQTAGGEYKVGSYVSADSIATSAEQMSNTYKQLKQTLFERDAAAGETTPYEYFVKHDASGKVQGMEADGSAITLNDNTAYYFYTDGDASTEPVAMIINNTGGSLSIGSSLPRQADNSTSICLIIASGNVVVDQYQFDGLIISGGTVEMRQNLYAAETAVTAAMEAINPTTGKAFKEFLRDGAVADSSEDSHVNTDTWNLDNLVTFKNWTKN